MIRSIRFAGRRMGLSGGKIATLFRGPGRFVVLACCIGLASAPGAWAQTTTRASVSSDEVEAQGDSLEASITDVGNAVVFESTARNLVPGDNNGLADIFVRAGGSTARVSVTTSEQEVAADSEQPSVSGNGQFAAFECDGALVSGDNNGHRDIYVRDMVNGTTERVSVTDTEGEANGASFDPAMSDDGRFVVFHSDASNLIGADTNGATDIYIRDRRDGTTRRVSVTDTETQSNGGSFRPAITGGGRFVVFESDATNLTAATDSNGASDIYIRDRTDGTTRRVSVTDTETQSNGISREAGISAGGRYVVFASRASNLIGSADTNGVSDVYIRDRTSGTTRRVSVSNTEQQANDDSSGQQTVSSDGRFVAFVSEAGNLVTGDNNGDPDVFVRDRTNGTTTRVSVTSAGTQGTPGSAGLRDSAGAAISEDGRFVAFTSFAGLVTEDTNLVKDVYIRDRGGFGERTRVRLELARKRIPARGPITVRVRNGNEFPVPVALSARSARRVPVGKRERRVSLKPKEFKLDGESQKTAKLKLPSVLRRLLRRDGKLSLRLTAKVTGPAGRTRVVRKKVTPRLRSPGR